MADADVSGLKAEALKRWEEGFLEAAARLETDLRTAAPVGTGSDTGGPRLVDSITVTVNRPSEVLFSLVAEAPVIQALTTNYGARPHIIVPKRAGGVLAFNWPQAGGMVFLRRVNHPGNVGTRWWSKLIDDMPNRLAEAIGV